VPDATDEFVGGKIGKSTSAKETYMGVFRVTIQGQKRAIAIIILGSEDVYGDTLSILNQIHRTF
jgi:hypothetical protein